MLQEYIRYTVHGLGYGVKGRRKESKTHASRDFGNTALCKRVEDGNLAGPTDTGAELTCRRCQQILRRMTRRGTVLRSSRYGTGVLVRFTYDTRIGDECLTGWHIPGLGDFPLSDRTASFHRFGSARDVIHEISDVVGCLGHVEDRGTSASFYAADPHIELSDGSATYYAAHIYGDPRLVKRVVGALKGAA